MMDFSRVAVEPGLDITCPRPAQPQKRGERGNEAERKQIFSIQLAKRKRNPAEFDLDQAGAYEYTKEVMSQNAMAEDAQEGITAFLGKRKACWKR